MKLRSKTTKEINDAEAREDGIYLLDNYTGEWRKYSLNVKMLNDLAYEYLEKEE